MVNQQTQGRSQSRKIIAAALLSLLVLRGLSFLGIAGAFVDSSSIANPIVSSLFIEDHCDRAKDNSDRSGPIQNCSDCCVLCMSTARDSILPEAPSFKETDSLFVGASVSPSTFYPNSLGSARPPGFIANWSATSPPLVS